MDPHRKFWNEQQQQLLKALENRERPEEAIRLFLDHHAMVHSSRMAEGELHSFVDEALEGLEEPDFRVIPEKEDHSIAWILWHLARIEDVTMNILVAGRSPVLNESWYQVIGFDSIETGNALDPAGIKRLSQMVNVEALQDYRVHVGRRTREIVQELDPKELEQKISPAGLERILEDGAVVESTRWLLEYWGKKTVAGLLLMPPTRHNFVHLNEAARLNKKIRKYGIIHNFTE